MNIIILEQNEYPAYSRFINNHKNTQFEHTLEWAKILFQNFGHKSTHLIAKDQDNNTSN